MTRFHTTLLSFLSSALLLASGAEPSPLKTQSISELEQRIEAIDSELSDLAHLSLRSGVGAIGYRSRRYDDATHTEWIEVDLAGEETLDQIILVPCIWRDKEAGFRADAFPREFRILAGNESRTETNVLASFEGDPLHLPRIAPLIINFPGIQASWIRIEATQLSPHAWDGKYYLQLAEILAFSSQRNVALRRPVTTSSEGWGSGGARREEFLVNGSTPYLMDAAQSEQSIAFVSAAEPEARHVLNLDFGTPHVIDRIHLHAIDLSDTIPQANPSDFGVPEHLFVEGANHPDFSDATLLLDYHKRSLFDVSPILMLPIPPTSCRYLRLIAEKPYIFKEDGLIEARLGFAEIEVFEGNRNIAKGIAVSSSIQKDNEQRSLATLTDGKNLYGAILPIRDWLNQLARRHDLERERPKVAAALNDRYLRQKINLRRMMWLAALLTAGIGFTVLIDRLIQMRKISNIRERLAADLHDELGANLHTIGLLSDLAEGSKGAPEELSMLHQRIRAVTERTGTAMRHCTDMLEAKGLYTGLLSDMQRASKRIMAGLEHEITIEGDAYLSQLNPRTRVDLFLFFKESLVNISRHSGATEFQTRLTATSQQILLSIQDNGSGNLDEVPPSLKRRARLLGATVSVAHPAEGGTCIHLKLRTRHRKART